MTWWTVKYYLLELESHFLYGYMYIRYVVSSHETHTVGMFNHKDFPTMPASRCPIPAPSHSDDSRVASPSSLLNEIPGVATSFSEKRISQYKMPCKKETYTIVLCPQCPHLANFSRHAIACASINFPTPTQMCIVELKRGVVGGEDFCQIMPERSVEGSRRG